MKRNENQPRNAGQDGSQDGHKSKRNERRDKNRLRGNERGNKNQQRKNGCHPKGNHSRNKGLAIRDDSLPRSEGGPSGE
jgi:hypothetical protein